MQVARRHLRFSSLVAALLALAAVDVTAGQPSPGPEPARSSTRAASRPNALLYTVKPGDTLDRICALLRERAGYYSVDDMLAAVRRANRLQTNLLRPGRDLLVPLAVAAPAATVARSVSDGAPVRGLYLAGPACGVSSVLQRVDRFILAGGNTVVFDAKDLDGAVTYRSTVPLAGWGKGRDEPMIPSLPAMVGRFHDRGLHVVARMAVFLDGEMGGKCPDLAQLGPGGTRCAELGAKWLDPMRPEVRAYNLALAAELARAGVDEVQLDYVRYPAGLRVGRATGDVRDDPEATRARRCETITAFVAAARDTLHALDATLSVVLGGDLGWDGGGDAILCGQDVAMLAASADILCPTIFPGQFAPGFAGCRRPAAEPAWIAAEGVRRFRTLAGEAAQVRPWLQAFPWHVQDFDGAYVAAQVKGAQGGGADGWCLWSPTSQYDASLPVMSSLTPPVATAAAMGVLRR